MNTILEVSNEHRLTIIRRFYHS